MNEQTIEDTANNRITFKNEEKKKTLTLSYDEKYKSYKVELTDKKNKGTKTVDFDEDTIFLNEEKINCLQDIFDQNFDQNFLSKNTQGIKDNKEMFFGLFETLEKVLRETKKYYVNCNNIGNNEKENYTSKLESIYFVKKNKYPKWFSLGGALNFDYDFSLENINGDDIYYCKLNDIFDILEFIVTRNNNGWITENGWINRTINWFSNLNCRECNNAEPEINNEIINDELEGEVAEPA